jgi:putative ABC transport system permease protein
MSNFVRELRFAGRSLARKPGFSAVAILTVAVAIASCTVIYSIVHGVLIQPLPYPDADRLVQVWQVNRGASGREGQFSDPNFEDVRDRSRAFAAIGQYGAGTSTVVAGDAPLRVQVSRVSAQFFDVFQTAPVRGRLFAADDRHVGAAPVAVVSHGFWQRAMGEPDVGSATIRVGDRAHLVIGVMPPRFQFPDGTEIWVPREQIERNPYRTGHNWRVVGRLGPDAPLGAARADVTTVARQLEQSLGDDTLMADVAVVPLHEQIAGRVRRPLVVLLAAVACLLVIACANLANLLVVHVSGRRRELAVRSALVAGRGSLAQPLLAETTLLTAAGGVLGIALGAAGLRAVIALEPGNLPRIAEIGVRWPVVLASLGVTAATAVVLGLAVSWSAVRGNITDSLKQGQRGQTGSTGTTRLRNVLVVAQLAVSLVLLASAGLLGRSLAVLLAQDPGFRTEQTLTIDLTVAGDTPELQARRVQFYEQVLDRLRALPGVRSAGGVSGFPLGNAYANGTFIKVTGDEPMQSMEQMIALAKDPARTGYAEFRVTTPGYFRAMDIPLLQGRVFEDADTADAQHVAVVSQSLARTTWPGGDPIGRKVQFGGMDGDLRVFTVVGVVGDIRERGLDSDARATLYAEYRQRPRVTGAFTMVLHAQGDPASLISPARAAIRELNPDVAPRFRPIEQVFSASVADRRFSLLVLGAFAGVALLLAVLGIYGVLSYAVAQRTHEFGVRLALGAQPRDVWRLVIGQAALLVAAGVAIGLAISRLVTRAIQTMLYGVTPTDPFTFAAVVAVLVLTALVACQLPALRATRADPLSALRMD